MWWEHCLGYPFINKRFCFHWIKPYSLCCPHHANLKQQQWNLISLQPPGWGTGADAPRLLPCRSAAAAAGCSGLCFSRSLKSVASHRPALLEWLQSSGWGYSEYKWVLFSRMGACAGDRESLTWEGLTAQCLSGKHAAVSELACETTWFLQIIKIT